MKRFCRLTVLILSVTASTSYDMFALTNITSEEEFNQILNQKTKVVVDFYAEWCGPCKQMKITLEQVEKDYQDIMFVKVNIDSLRNLANKFKVRSIPTVIFFKDGQKVKQFVGAKSKAEISALINNVFS